MKSLSEKIKSIPPADRPLWVILGLIVACGLATRFIGLGHRSLWIDEAWVANLIESKSYLSTILYEKQPYWSPLPLLFAASIKAAVSLFGNGEAAFRLVPCLFGAASIFLLCFLSRETFGASRLWMIPPGLIALHPVAIYYSKELKQFSAGVFFAILLLYLYTLVIKKKDVSIAWLVAFVCAAFVAIGFAIPLIILVGSISLLLGLKLYLRKAWKPLAVLVVGVGAVGAAEGLMYLFWLRPQLDPAYLSWWETQVFPPEGIAATVRWLVNRGFSFFSYEFGFPTLALGEGLRFRGELLLSYFAFILCGLGIICLFLEKRRDLVYIYLITILSMLALSFMHIWPLGGSRVNLFLMPLHLIFIAKGAGLLATAAAKAFSKAPLRWAVAAGCALLILPIQGLDENLRHLKEREEMGPVIESVKNDFDPETQRVFVYFYAKEAFRHYWNMDGRHRDEGLCRFGTSFREEPPVHVAEIVEYRESLPAGVKSFYLIFSHIPLTRLDAIMELSRKELGEEVDSEEATGAFAYLFEVGK